MFPNRNFCWCPTILIGYNNLYRSTSSKDLSACTASLITIVKSIGDAIVSLEQTVAPSKVDALFSRLENLSEYLDKSSNEATLSNLKVNISNYLSTIELGQCYVIHTGLVQHLPLRSITFANSSQFISDVQRRSFSTLTESSVLSSITCHKRRNS